MTWTWDWCQPCFRANDDKKYLDNITVIFLWNKLASGNVSMNEVLFDSRKYLEQIVMRCNVNIWLDPWDKITIQNNVRIWLDKM